MADRYEEIRKALAKGPTPGPWRVCPTNSGTFVKSERVSGRSPPLPNRPRR